MNMVLDGTLKNGELKAYEDLGNGWVEEIDTNKVIKDQLREENTQLRKENAGLKEQVEYLRRSCERKEETIYEQYDELVGLDTKIDSAIKYIQEHTFWKLSASKVLKILKGEK